MSDLEDILAGQLRVLRYIPTPVREYRFCDRRWKFDFAWPDRMVAVEVEGGTFIGGRHTRGAGFEADLAKYNEAALLGWCVLRATGRMIDAGIVLVMLERALGVAAG